MSRPFLPTVGRPVKTSAQTPQSTILPPGTCSPRRRRYSVVSYTNVAAVARPAFAQLGHQKVDGATRSSFTALPWGVPSQIASLAGEAAHRQPDHAGRGGSQPGELLVRDNYTSARDAPPAGSSLASIEHFLLVGEQGQPDQNMSQPRSSYWPGWWGLPARVAVRVLLDQRDWGGARPVPR